MPNLLAYLIAFLGLATGVALSLAAVAAMRGWVLTKLWAWFIVPFGAPALSIPYAIGLALIVTYLTSRTSITKTAPTEIDWTKAFVEIVVGPLLTLLLGWAVTLFL